jgi:prepilin-type N-terminal cleavage/methylation domain-containing protein
MKFMVLKNPSTKPRGFTLIELLIIIAVIAILATIVFVALNPLARFQDSRNSRRWTDINAILNAIKLYEIDKKGVGLSDMDHMIVGRPYQIGNGNDCNLSCISPVLHTELDCVDFSPLITSGYLPAMPFDPNASNASATHTNYYVIKSDTGAITVGACTEELGTNASVPEINSSR